VTPLRVGIVGAHPSRGWGLVAHLPAVRSLPELSLAAVSARTDEAAAQAAAAFGAPRAFGDSLALVHDPDIDVVAVTVKVAEHRAIVLAALQAGKHVYCEWPLGRDLVEASELAGALPTGVHAPVHVAIGLQGLLAPAIARAATLIRDGAIGRPLGLRAFGTSGAWGRETTPFYTYLQQKGTGATFESIGVGHVLPAVEALVGDYLQVDARASTWHRRIPVAGTAEVIDRTCADHLLLLGQHSSGCVSTLEIVGGTSDRPVSFEIVGETGWIRISGTVPGMYQIAPLQLEASFPVESPVPEPGLTGPAANVARIWQRLASDIVTGGRTVPDFDRAVRLTALLDGIEQASTSGQRRLLGGQPSTN
jgi:predicted dehydrogenase